jgi:hypothetical protein
VRGIFTDPTMKEYFSPLLITSYPYFFSTYTLEKESLFDNGDWRISVSSLSLSFARYSEGNCVPGVVLSDGSFCIFSHREIIATFAPGEWAWTAEGSVEFLRRIRHPSLPFTYVYSLEADDLAQTVYYRFIEILESGILCAKEVRSLVEFGCQRR